MDARAGDVFGSRARGLQGVVIRRGTRSNVGHCGILVRQLDDSTSDPLWETHEALGGRGPRGFSGVQVSQRRLSTVVALRRPFEEHEVEPALIRSLALADLSRGYDYREVVRCGVLILGRDYLRPLRPLLERLAEWVHRTDDPNRLFCSEHTWRVVTATRPDLAALSPYSPDRIWPGEVTRALED